MSCPERKVLVLAGQTVVLKKTFKKERKASAFIQKWLNRGLRVLFF